MLLESVLMQETRALQSNTSMFTQKNNGKAAQSNKKPVKNYYCMSDIWCLHHGDRLKAAVHCFYRTFIVNNSLLVLYLQSLSIELPWLFKAFSSYYFWTYIICIRQVCTRCSCSSCIFSAKIFNKWFTSCSQLHVCCTWNRIYCN